MYLIVNRNTGKIVPLSGAVIRLEDFVFNTLDECLDYIWEDEDIPIEDVLIIRADKFFKPSIDFVEVEDSLSL